MFAALMNLMKTRKMLPQISDTERQALDAGTVWIDGEIFGGNPDFKKMLAENYNKLTAEEQAFLDGPTDEVCRMIDRLKSLVFKEFELMLKEEVQYVGFSDRVSH